MKIRKIFASFCVCELTYNALQHKLFFFFSPVFWTNWRTFSPVCSVCFQLFNMLLVEVRGSRIQLVSLDTPANSCSQFLLIFVHKHKQTLKHAFSGVSKGNSGKKSVKMGESAAKIETYIMLKTASLRLNLLRDGHSYPIGL